MRRFGSAAADDFDAERTRDPIKFLDSNFRNHHPNVAKKHGGNAFGDSFEEVRPTFGQDFLDGFNNHVVGQDAIDIVVLIEGPVFEGHGNIEENALRFSSFRFEGPDIDAAKMVPEHQTVTT